MKRLVKFITTALIIAATLANFVACGSNSANGAKENKISLSLKLQCDVVARYDCNAFILATENVDDDTTIEYQLAQENGEYETVKQTQSRYVAYRCLEEGKHSVRACVKVKGKIYYSNSCDFTTVQDGGDTFGYSPIGEEPSHNVDLTNDKGEYPYIEHKSVNKYSEEYAYFKGIYSDKFVLTATIQIIGTNCHDPYPKVGLFAKVGKNIYYSAFDPSPQYNGNTITFAVYKSSWSWSNGISVNAPFRDANNNLLSHSMTLLRDGTTFYIAVDGVYVSKRVISDLSGNSSVGTFTMSQNALYTDYSCFVEGSDEFSAALTSAEAAKL